MKLVDPFDRGNNNFFGAEESCMEVSLIRIAEQNLFVNDIWTFEITV